MTETELAALCAAITPPDEAARAAAHAHWAALAKPLGGLGSLETMLEDAAALTGTPELDFARRAVLVLCADNGVVAQGVSQTDASVTRTVLRNGAVINVPAQVFAFTGGMLHYHAHQSGISIQLVNVYKTVKNANTGKPLNIVDGTSLQVEPNSLSCLWAAPARANRAC